MSTDIYDHNEDKVSPNINATTIKEINQNADTENFEVDTFREWVSSMDHLKCPTDSKFLIKFLRVAKFDQEKAKRRLERFCTVRGSPKGSPQFFEYFQIDDPIIDQVLNLKILIPLGVNHAEEFVLLFRPRGWNPDEIPFNQVIKVIYMSMDCLMSDERLQIYGLVILYDLGGVSKKALRAWARPSVIKVMVKILRESMQIRNRLQIFHNEPLIFDIAYDILSLFMNAKLKQRSFRIKSNIRKAIDRIPGLEEILPTEYEGQGGTVDECTERWKERFLDYFKDGNPLEGIQVDESKRK